MAVLTSPFSRRAGERARMFSALASLTRAGVPVRQAAALLARDGRAGLERRAAGALEEGLAAGRSISQALAPVLTPLELAVVEPAEKSGRLAEGFSHLESWHQVRQRSAVRFGAAALYPFVMVHVAAVLPAAAGAVMTGGGDPQAAAVKALLMLWIGLAAVAAVLVFWVRQAAVSPVAAAALLRLPVAGPALKSLALSRWMAVLHFQIGAGLRISGALRGAGEAAGSAVLNQASAAAARAVEQDGATLGEALRKQRAFPGLITGTLEVAETAGTLDHETRRLAAELETEADSAAERAAAFAGTVFYIAAALLAVWQIFRLTGLYGGMLENFMKSL